MKLRASIGLIVVLFAGGCGSSKTASETVEPITELTASNVKKLVERLGYSRIQRIYSPPIDFARLSQTSDLKTLAECGQKQSWWNDKGDRGPQGGQLFFSVPWPLKMSPDRTVSLALQTSNGEFQLTGPLTTKPGYRPAFKIESPNSIDSEESDIYFAPAKFTHWGAYSKTLAVCGLVPYAQEETIPSLQMKFAKSRAYGVWYAAEFSSPDGSTTKEVPMPNW